MIERINGVVLCAVLGVMPAFGVVWILGVPDALQWGLVIGQMSGVMLGLATAGAFLKHPYGRKAGILELALGIAAVSAWLWMAINLDEWLLRMAERTPDMWAPGVVAIVLMMEGLRKAAGKVIAGLVWVLILYAFFGDHMPGVLEAEVFPPTKTVLYLYADVNGIPGLVLRVVVELVLAFIIFGKMLETSGATNFLNELALGWMGHRRGGPAKVAVVASAAFGSISGSTVANIMSTGVVTIPMMKRSGFRPEHAAAIEAVASNGGQIAPPVMGATAFIIAEFLEISYGEVVVAAALPALLYFFVVFLQVDAIALRFGIRGFPKADLPRVGATFLAGWVYLVPIGVLLWFLLGQGYNAGISGMYACGALIVLFLFKQRRVPTREEWRGFFVGSGENLVPLLLIGGGAGVIMGVMNSTGLAFQLSLMLTHVAENAGVFAMLLLTALICIVLGMGMPTAAVYIVLVSVVAPALVKMGLSPLGAHMFIFYFGLLSMLTPPVAIASMVAAELAGAGMWRTGAVGVQLAITAYLLPFLWAFNPAILLDGSIMAIAIVLATAIAAGIMIAQCAIFLGGKGLAGRPAACVFFLAALAVGSATLWIGPETPLALVPAVAGLVVVWFARQARNRAALAAAKA
jgi:TRAP transporter 4TM/12TM fusion protein